MRHAVEALFADIPEDENPPDDAAPEEEGGAKLPRAASGAAAGRTVARAIKDAVSLDVYEALAEAIRAGETLQTFQQRIEEVARKKGWMATATEQQRAWRARIIFETNLRMHYQAERYRQITEPSVMAFYPYWQYVHGQLRTPMRPRPEHVAWHGLVLSADDPFWRAHFPPNGWGCTCGVKILSRRDLARLGKEAPDDAPKWGVDKFTDPETGETRDIPRGIDPGFDCTPVEWMERLPLRAKAARQKAFEAADKAKAARPAIDVTL